jgi:multidrug efflux pump subunit AcrA (membrane-fusion protein)
MVLYAAKLKANAKPVSKKTDLKKKEVEPEPEPVVDKKALAKQKRQEAARLKKEQADSELKRQEDEAKAALAAKEAELKAAEDALAAKKEAQKEKRRASRQAKKQLETPPESVTTEPPMIEKSKPKRKRKSPEPTMDEQVDQAVAQLEVKEEEPPAWFRKYVAGVKNEERMHQEPKKPKKEVAREANQVAEQQWGNGLVRDRVRNEVDKHMGRMYQMIFNRGSFDGL